MSKKKVAIDLDDTLAATIEGTLAFASSRLGVDFSHGDITTVEYWANYGISDTEAIALVHDYNLAGFPGLQPIEDAAETLRVFKRRYDYYIVTAREEAVAAATHRWVDRFFPDLFQDIVFVGNPYVNKNARSKETVCSGLGVTILIDDSLSHTMACAKMGIEAVLFGGHAWHLNAEEHALITPAKDWKQVEEYFNGQS
jgi:5'(3')-deoxyribonucleotidase